MSDERKIAILNDERTVKLPQVWNERKETWELLTKDSLAAQLQKQLIAEQHENAKLRDFVERVAGGGYPMTDTEGARSDAQILLIELKEESE